MKRFFGRIENGEGFVEGEELVHLKSVLRLQEGEDVILINGDGKLYEGQISKISKNYAQIAIKTVKKCPNNPKKQISLFISAIKREKLEMVVQKAVELGVKNLFVFESQFSAMKLSNERLSRYQKIVTASLKQCERADAMGVEIVSFDQMLKLFSKCSTRLFANEREGEEFDLMALKNADDIGILIGCEGGFSQEEKAQILSVANPENISLGKRILRAETAAILLCGLASLLNGN